jgi:predicted transcriptional regulator
LLKEKNDYLDVKDISKNIGFSEQHTRRILRHLFSEELLIRKDYKNNNGRPNHLYGSKNI